MNKEENNSTTAEMTKETKRVKGKVGNVDEVLVPSGP